METTKYLESDEVRDEDIVVRVITDKGAVCMTSEKYDAYLKKMEKEQKKKANSTPKSSEN